jgi:hypothetical protein
MTHTKEATPRSHSGMGVSAQVGLSTSSPSSHAAPGMTHTKEATQRSHSGMGVSAQVGLSTSSPSSHAVVEPPPSKFRAKFVDE